MDGVFEKIKSDLSMKEVAAFYGLELDRAGMACCPFHDDKTPSLKVYEDHFYCFGCGEHGDATSFVAKMFGLRQIEAARKLSDDFGLRLFDDKGIAVPVSRVMSESQKYRSWLKSAAETANDYYNMLVEWKAKYAPHDHYAEPHKLFIESISKDTLSIKAGDTATLTFVINPEDTKDKTVVWKSSNESIATVSGGTITAINEGSCTISISTSNGKTDSCEITVTSAGPDFNALYNEFCSSKYAKVASDGSYLSIDTNPYDKDDSFDYEAYTSITKVNEALGFPESVLNKMGQTRSLDGMQTYTGKEVEVTWSYHPDHGLDVIYSLIDCAICNALIASRTTFIPHGVHRPRQSAVSAYPLLSPAPYPRNEY